MSDLSSLTHAPLVPPLAPCFRLSLTPHRRDGDVGRISTEVWRTTTASQVLFMVLRKVEGGWFRWSTHCQGQRRVLMHMYFLRMRGGYFSDVSLSSQCPTKIRHT